MEFLQVHVDHFAIMGYDYDAMVGAMKAMGFATGGLDYHGKGEEAAVKAQNFGAGGGTGLSIQPLGFLVVDAEGDVEMINVGVKNPTDPIEQLSDLIERSPEIITKIKAIFKKDSSEE